VQKVTTPLVDLRRFRRRRKFGERALCRYWVGGVVLQCLTLVHLTRKNRPHNVFGGTLNPTLLCCWAGGAIRRGFELFECLQVVNVTAAAQVRLTPRIYDGLSFSEGQTINVRVPVLGQPVPKVTWFKDGEELLTEAGRREVWLEDGYAVLNITSCRRTSDRGVYGIRVENSLAVDEASFTVEITGNNSLFVTNNNNNNTTIYTFLYLYFL